MSLELVNTFGTLLTVAIIAATAIAAMVQLRHLRAGNQINAQLTIGDHVDRKEFQSAVTLVRQGLDSAMEDSAYRDYVLAINRRMLLPPITAEHRELHAAAVLVAHTYERIGVLVKNKIIDREILLDQTGSRIINTYNAMTRWHAWARAVSGDQSLGENFEYLTVLAEDFQREHPTSYPAGVRRLQLHSPWPVPQMPATA